MELEKLEDMRRQARLDDRQGPVVKGRKILCQMGWRCGSWDTQGRPIISLCPNVMQRPPLCLGEEKLWQLVGSFLKLGTITRIDHIIKVDARPRRGKTNSFPLFLVLRLTTKVRLVLDTPAAVPLLSTGDLFPLSEFDDKPIKISYLSTE